MGGDGQSDWCDCHLDGDPVVLNVLQHAVDIESAMQSHPYAGLQRRHDVEQAENVRRRRRDLNAVVGGQTQGLTPMPHRDLQRMMAVPNGFRQAGRS